MKQVVIDALQHPFRDAQAVRKLLLGAVLNMVPIANFMSFGYTLRLLEQVLDGEEQLLPEWRNPGDLFIRGVKVLVVGFVYMAVPLLLLAAGAGTFLFSLAALIAGLLEPMALVHLARTGTIGPAFALPTMWAEIQSVFGEYLGALVVWYAVFFLVALALSGTDPPLLWILGSFVGFYLYLAFACLFGRVCSRSRVARYGPS